MARRGKPVELHLYEDNLGSKTPSGRQVQVKSVFDRAYREGATNLTKRYAILRRQTSPESTGTRKK
jgi:hypothetical protein